MGAGASGIPRHLTKKCYSVTATSLPMTMKRSAPPLVQVERVSTLSLEVTETPVSITERSCIAESQVVYAPLSFHSSAQGEVSLPDSSGLATVNASDKMKENAEEKM